MREYTQGLVRLGFELISAEEADPNGNVFLIYYHWDHGALLTVEGNDKQIHKVHFYFVWSPNSNQAWALSYIDFASTELTSIPADGHGNIRYFVVSQTLCHSIILLNDKLNMMQVYGEFLLPWPRQPLLNLCLFT